MTTKVCPMCHSDAVVGLSSMNRKICSDCSHEYPWPLDDGQTSLLAPSRAVPKVEWPKDDEGIIASYSEISI